MYKVIVKTPSRLHFSLIDLHGGIGRVDGGVGVALKAPNFVIEVERSARWEVPAQSREIVARIIRVLRPGYRYRMWIKREIPAHVGLGSQTQLALAIAKGLYVLEQRTSSVRELAGIVGRGGTSGIGVAAFESGGLVLDGGHSKKLKPYFAPSHFSPCPPPPVLARYVLPENWYFVVVVPEVEKQIFGEEERNIFENRCPISEEEVQKVARIVLMRLLPAAVEHDIESFGFALTALQYVGFKKVENELAAPEVRELRVFLEKNSFGGGLSSFGPAVFGIVRGKSTAIKLKRKVAEFLRAKRIEHKIYVAGPENRGAKVFIKPAY